MKKTISFTFLIVFLTAFFSCKSTEQEIVPGTAEEIPGIKTYVNTSVSNATGTISTILVFNRITEVTCIHPKTRERFTLEEKDFVYDPKTTNLEINLPEYIRYKIYDLGFHIVGYAADPGVFVLSGIDPKRSTVGVFFEGKKSVEGKDYSYDKTSHCLTSLVPLNVDADSFQICWATRNGFVNFSNNTEKYKDAYQKYYNEWARSIYLN